VTKGNTDKFSYLTLSVINTRPVFLLLEVNAKSNLQLLIKTSQFTLKNTGIFFANGCENSLKPCSSQFQPIYNLGAFFFLSFLFFLFCKTPKTNFPLHYWSYIISLGTKSIIYDDPSHCLLYRGCSTDFVNDSHADFSHLDRSGEHVLLSKGTINHKTRSVYLKCIRFCC